MSEGAKAREVSAGAMDEAAARRLLAALVDSKAIDFDAVAKVMAETGHATRGDALAAKKAPFTIIRLYTNVIRFVTMDASGEGTLADPAEIKAAVDRALGR